jgi:hypothetical protein
MQNADSDKLARQCSAHILAFFPNNTKKLIMQAGWSHSSERQKMETQTVLASWKEVTPLEKAHQV